jgi:hypothetical protein
VAFLNMALVVVVVVVDDELACDLGASGLNGVIVRSVSRGAMRD